MESSSLAGQTFWPAKLGVQRVDAFYSYAISLVYRPFPTLQLITMIQLLFLLLGVVLPPSHQSPCDSTTTIDHSLIVSDTGNDTAECLNGSVPCHTLEYVLQYDKLCNNNGELELQHQKHPCV